MFGLISKKKHEAEVAEYREAYFSAADRCAELGRQNDALEAELANWRAHGQLRDPKTGWLIPKVKP